MYLQPKGFFWYTQNPAPHKSRVCNTGGAVDRNLMAFEDAYMYMYLYEIHASAWELSLHLSLVSFFLFFKKFPVHFATVSLYCREARAF